MPAPDPTRKVLLIGWDAADWKAITPLIDQGKMPNLEAMINTGICGNLATLQPVLSPILWTSIATGKRAYKHGIHGFSEPDPVSGLIRPVTNLSRKTKAIWNILNQEKLKTVTIGWWPSNPVEELSHGVMVSNDYQTSHGSDPEKWRMKPGTVHPEKLSGVLADVRVHPAHLTEENIRAFLPGLNEMSREELDKAEKDPRVQSLMKIVADCSSIHSAGMLLNNSPWDFMAIYHDAIDHFGHAFMKYHPPKRKHIDDWDYKLFHFCLEAGYRYHDQMLGELLSKVDSETTVILMSDHGFHPDHMRPTAIPREPAGPAIEHRQFGIFVAKGPGIRKDDRIYGANLLDVCPTILHLFGLPVGRDMDGKVLLDIYDAEEPPSIERIESWDAVPGDHGMHPEDRQIAPADSKAALDQLVALGYIDKPDADRSKALDQTVRELDFNLAQACIDGGLYSDAIEILERLYEKWPDQHRFGFNLATCYQKTGRPSDLRELVNLIIERRIEEANLAVEELDSLKPEDEAAAKREEEKIEEMSESEKRKFFRHRSELVAKARPNLYSLVYLEVFADFAEKKYEEALQRLQQIDSEYGARIQALILKGEVCQHLKMWTDSQSAFEEALSLDAESPSALLGLARTALAQREFESACGYACDSIGLLFFQPRAHYIHGIAQYRRGNWEEAEMAFTICVNQAPLFSAAYRMLGEIARRFKNDPAQYLIFADQVKASRRRKREVRDQKSSLSVAQNSHTAPSGDTVEGRSLPALKGDPSAFDRIPEDEIITVVSGLPRSGTSLMMQILEAAGLPIFSDGVRKADESNQRGYFEHEKVASLLSNRDRRWLADARGRALKVVAPLLSGLPGRLLKTVDSEEPPGVVHYRLIYMERDMDEILSSQNSMLARLGRENQTEVDRRSSDVAKAYRQQERRARQWCAAPRVQAMAVNFSTLVHRPDDILPQLAEFLRTPDQVEAMRACIDTGLHRVRKK